MKFDFFKKIFFFIIFFSFLGLSFGFFVENSLNDNQIYFNFENDFVNVVFKENFSYLNLSFVEIDKVGQNDLIFKDYKLKFKKCKGGEDFCVFFNIKDLILDLDLDVKKSYKINLSLNDDFKVIFYDVKKPVLKNLNYQIDIDKKKINFYFDYFDDVGFYNLKVFKKINSEFNLVEDLGFKKNFTLDNIKFQDYEFLFELKDLAGNVNHFQKNVVVSDLNKPKINFLDLKFNDYENSCFLVFELEDDNLDFYQIEQDSYLIKENIYGKVFRKELRLEDCREDVVLKVFDKTKNLVSKKINLNKRIDFDFESKFFNDNEFEFDSDADNCFLEKINSKVVDEKFSHSGKGFSIFLDILDKDNFYDLYFFCEKDNVFEYFKKEFVFDLTKPEDVFLEAFCDDNGNIDLRWSKSLDKFSSVEYVLYRDSEKIYRGSKRFFEDTNVEFPNNYTYFVKVVDEAKNFVLSNNVTSKPKKVKINFFSDLRNNLRVNFSDFDFFVKTDSGSDVFVKHLVSNKVVFNKSFFDVDNVELNFDFVLESGGNVFEILIRDDFSNVFKRRFLIFFDNFSDQNLNENVFSLVNDSLELNQNKESFEENLSSLSYKNGFDESGLVFEKEDNFFGFCFYLFLFVFVCFLVCVFGLFFVFDKRFFVKSFKKRRVLSGNKGSKKDLNLEKDFLRIKNNRIRKQKLIREEILREKKANLRKRTDFENKKLDDLSIKRDFVLDNSFIKEKNLGFKENVKKSSKKKKSVLRGDVAQKTNLDYNYDLDLDSSFRKDNFSRGGFFRRKEEKVDKNLNLQGFDSYLKSFTLKRGFNDLSENVFKEKKKLDDKQDFIDEDKFFKNQKDLNDKDFKVDDFKNNQRAKFLDDYLFKVVKKNKKKSFYFSEKQVEEDLKRREF